MALAMMGDALVNWDSGLRTFSLTPDTRNLTPVFSLPLFSYISPESPSYLKGRGLESGDRMTAPTMAEGSPDFGPRTSDFFPDT
jgi:hypothetical protein